MTEDGARTKWCPFAMVGSQLGGSYNRDTQGVPPVDRCIASECMMWKWTIAPEKEFEMHGKTPTGYCGLAP